MIFLLYSLKREDTYGEKTPDDYIAPRIKDTDEEKSLSAFFTVLFEKKIQMKMKR